MKYSPCRHARSADDLRSIVLMVFLMKSCQTDHLVILFFQQDKWQPSFGPTKPTLLQCINLFYFFYLGYCQLPTTTTEIQLFWVKNCYRNLYQLKKIVYKCQRNHENTCLQLCKIPGQKTSISRKQISQIGLVKTWPIIKSLVVIILQYPKDFCHKLTLAVPKYFSPNFGKFRK